MFLVVVATVAVIIGIGIIVSAVSFAGLIPGKPRRDRRCSDRGSGDAGFWSSFDGDGGSSGGDGGGGGGGD